MADRPIALIHDWLLRLRGGERCLLAFLCLYPKSDIFSLFYKKAATDPLVDKNFKAASLLNLLPFASKFYKMFLAFFPVVGLFDLKKYNFILSLSHAAAKNINKNNPESFHVCYCFTPMRYIWDQAENYLGLFRFFAWPLILALRAWDRKQSGQVDSFVAISSFVAARIRRFYRRRAEVIYPPVAVEWIVPERAKRPDGIMPEDKAFLFAGALVPYKGAEIAIQACVKLGVRLWVAGDGPLFPRLKSMASDNIKFLGQVSDSELAYLLLNCRALLFPCKEDFGILPLEAQAAGKPVVALYAGACKETLIGAKTWLDSRDSTDLSAIGAVFIKNSHNQTDLVQNTISAIRYFEKLEAHLSSAVCRSRAEKFSPAAFYDSWCQFLLKNGRSEELNIPSKSDFVSKFEGLRLEQCS